MPGSNPYESSVYDQTTTAGDIAKEVALSPFRLSTYLGAYTTVPWMWSIEKGIMIPGLGKYIEGSKSWSKTGRYIADAYKGRNVVSGTIRASARFGRSLWEGGGFVGKSFFDKSQSKYGKFNFNTEMSKNVKTQLGREIRSTMMDGDLKDPANKKIFRDLLDERYGKVMKNFNKTGAIPIKVKDSYIKTKNAQSEYVKKRAGKQAAKSLTTAAKIGIAGMKAATVIGLTMFAWDMISMIGQPLGAYATSSLHSTASQLQNQFMPEMGGKLSAAYLTRQAATERQRAIQAMSKAAITGRSAFGQEARMMHM